ncbi:MAG: hypothetical protein JJ975_09355, partial [Bacteroidia bacterium]|nr:hypothetical protein [Bacteroidia bacterium]
MKIFSTYRSTRFGNIGLLKHIPILLLFLVLSRNWGFAQLENQPILLTPFNNQVITSEGELRGTIFSWSGTSADFGYQIAIYPVYPCQDPLTAFRVNHPIYISYSDNEFFYLLEDMNFNDGKYVWSVTSNSGESTVWSPPSVFELSTGIGSGLFIEIDNPCDTPKGCMQIIREPDKEFPISVGVSIAEAEKFKYPRALPIKAEGLDYDKVLFRCKGCAADDGTETRYYQDRVSNFEWVLEGKGSLGDPFKQKKVDSLNNELDKINQEIADLLKKINEKQGLVDSGIDQQKEANADRIDDIKKQIASIDSITSVLTSKLDSIRQVQREHVTKLTSKRTKLRSKLDSITEIQTRLDTLNDLLADKFTPEELSMLAEVENLLSEKERIESELEREEQQFDQDIAAINATIDQREAEVQTKSNSYNAINQQIETSTKLIADLLARQYNNPALFNYYRKRNKWSLMARTFHDAYSTRNFESLFLTVSNKAQSVAQSTTNRSTPLSAFKQALSDLNAAIEKAKNKEGSTEANDAYRVYLASANAFRNSVDSLTRVTAAIDPSITQKIETEQDKLGSLELQIVSASEALDNAIAAFNREKEAYDNRINEFETTLNRLKQQLSETNENIASRQNAFNTKVEKRRAKTEENKDEYNEEIATKELIKLELNLEVTSIYEDIIRIQRDSSVTTKEIKFVEADKRELDRQKKALEEQIKTLEQENKDLDKKKADLKKELNKHNKELDELKKKKEDLIGKLEVATNATKSAKGAYVYYIPPTIDELIKGTADEVKFKELVLKVEEKKDSLKQAKQLKEGLQSTFSQMTVDIAKELITLKDIESSKKKLDADKKKADDKIADQKFAAGKKVKEAREKEEEEKKQREEKKKELKKDIEDLEKEAKDGKKAIKDYRELIRKNDSLLTDIRKLVEEKRKERQNEEQNEAQRKSNISDNTTKLRAKKDIETRLTKEIGRANNDLSRASAADNIPGIAQYRKELNRLEKEVEENKKEIDFYVKELGIMAGKLKTIRDKIKAIDDVINTQSEKYNTIQSIQRGRRIKLREMEGDHEASKSKLLQAKKDVKKLEVQQDSAPRENIDSLIAKDKDLEKAKKKAEEIDGKLKDLDKNKDKAQANIETILDEKKKAEDKAKKAVEDAEEKLKKAKKELKDFIENIFDKASFTTKLKVIATDDVIDQWRSKDDPKKENITLIYKDRVATLIGPKASGSGAKDESPSKCYPIIETDKLEPPAVGGIPVGREPRTIAMIYDEGRLLYEKWAVIPDDAPLLAKDVVIATVGIKEDKDEIKYQCISAGESPEEKAFRLDSEGNLGESSDGGGRPETGSGNTNSSTSGNSGNSGSEASEGTSTRTRERNPGEGSR